jgi:hypothetical protein
MIINLKIEKSVKRKLLMIFLREDDFDMVINLMIFFVINKIADDSFNTQSLFNNLIVWQYLIFINQI